MSNVINMERAKEILIRLNNCCVEGYDGTWDTTPPEGPEAFLDMLDDIQDLATILKIDISSAKMVESQLL